jgi:nucleotide-binding universal stress UspA family protein
MFERILVPLDGSRFGSQSIQYAKEIAHRFSAEIILIQAVKPTIPTIGTIESIPSIQGLASAEIPIQVAKQEDERNIKRARRYLSKKVREIKKQDIKASYHIILGNISRSIMGFARKNNIDLIVLTTHGKGGIKRAIMGSVTDEIIRKSGKPVLVIGVKKT